MDVVDVGTGLGILVRGPDFTLVYDSGSNDDDARETGQSDARATSEPSCRRSQRFDHLMLSHPHKDHLELLPDLLATVLLMGDAEAGGRKPPSEAPTSSGSAKLRRRRCTARS